MDKELILLDEIQNNYHITQRELAEKSGFSLGNVNFLLKKMIREDLIKIEHNTTNRPNYLLTGKGMRMKLSKTYNQLKNEYVYVEEHKQSMRSLTREILKKESRVQIFLFGDEISEMLKMSLDGLEEEKIEIFGIDLLSEIEIEDLDKDTTVMLAVPDEEEKWIAKGFKVINMLKYI